MSYSTKCNSSYKSKHKKKNDVLDLNFLRITGSSSTGLHPQEQGKDAELRIHMYTIQYKRSRVQGHLIIKCIEKWSQRVSGAKHIPLYKGLRILNVLEWTQGTRYQVKSAMWSTAWNSFRRTYTAPVLVNAVKGPKTPACLVNWQNLFSLADWRDFKYLAWIYPHLLIVVVYSSENNCVFGMKGLLWQYIFLMSEFACSHYFF